MVGKRGHKPRNTDYGNSIGLPKAVPFDMALVGDVLPASITMALGQVKLQKLASGAEDALLFSNSVLYHDGDDPRAHRIICHADDIARDIIAIEKVIARLVAAKSQLFRWTTREARHKTTHRKALTASPPSRGPARLAADFLSIMKSNFAVIRSAFPKEKHQLHPLVELFEQHMSRYDFSHEFKPLCELDVKRLNECVDAIRAEAMSPAFRRRVDKHLKLVRNNTRSTLELVDSLFMVYSQLLVIRIDLSYVRHPLKGWVALPVMDGNAVGDRARLIRYLQRKCPCRPVGYVWKTEWAEHTGWHTHLLLFFDGSRHQQDIAIARMIGEYWDKEITRGKGRHHISNLDHHQMRGVGRIRYDDAAKLWALCGIVVPYVTKADYYVRLLVPPKARMFGRSGLPKLPAKKLGRPRGHLAARVSSYTGSLNQPGYASRRPGKPKAGPQKGIEAHSKRHRVAPVPYRSLSKAEYEAKAREHLALGKAVWPHFNMTES